MFSKCTQISAFQMPELLFLEGFRNHLQGIPKMGNCFLGANSEELEYF